MIKTQHKSWFRPVAINVYPNFTVYETPKLGVNYKCNRIKGVILGLPISPKVNAGRAHDYGINDLDNYNPQTHDIFLNFQRMLRKTDINLPDFTNYQS